MLSLKEAHTAARKLLKDAQIPDYKYESVCLVTHFFNITHDKLIADGEIIEADENVYKEMISVIPRREIGEPLQYILGKWTFMGLDILVGPGVLIPRDDTEVVVNCCLEYLKQLPAPKVLDLCAGSGAVTLALKKQVPNAKITAIEKWEPAFEYLIKNVKLHTLLNHPDITLVCDDIFKCAPKFSNGAFDLIISNPPYIKTEEIKSLQKEVLFEPAYALNGGPDGYDFYKVIIEKWTEKLRAGGMLCLELGENQFETVHNLMQKSGYGKIQPHLDIAGTKRAVSGVKFESYKKSGDAGAKTHVF